MGVLSNLQPAAVFHYFEEICGIPHTSFHEKALSDYCVAFAKEHNLFYQQDALGNVLMLADATEGYEQEEPLILQGHLDMVGVKTADCPLDLEKDGLQLYIDGDYIYADGTSLGADNGIAVAYILAILDADDIPHPRLEIALTVSEEVGLIGASAMDFSMCQGRRMINLDSEIEGILTAGCAGGRRVACTIPMVRETASGIRVDLSFQGMLGGHSGLEINKGRGNAISLMGRFLLLLQDSISFCIHSLNGGTKENVIPNQCTASLLIDPKDQETFQQVLTEFSSEISNEYSTADPSARLVASFASHVTCAALDSTSADKLLTGLNLLPTGVQAMSMDLPGLVETSLNMGVAELTDAHLCIRFSIRSSITSAKATLTRKLQHLTHMLGGEIQVSGDYPAWPFAKKSPLRKLCVRKFKEQYGSEPSIDVIHAGLECGILSDKLEGLDCISFGPNLIDIHSVNEHVSIASVARVWEYLLSILASKA